MHPKRRIVQQTQPDQVTTGPGHEGRSLSLLRTRQEKLKPQEKGQIILLVVFAIVGLIVVTGLVVDGGLFFIQAARLRRAVDAAAIATALQIREGYQPQDLIRAAEQFNRLNQDDIFDIEVRLCDYSEYNPTRYGSLPPLDDAYQDQSLCSDPPRKLVQVSASRRIYFGFLPVIGIQSTTIRAAGVGEAAAVDVVLVIDSSASMAYETAGNPNQADDPADDPAACNPTNSCQPFRAIKDVAKGFVNTLYFPFDRIAVVSFNRDVTILTNNTPPPGCGNPCPWFDTELSARTAIDGLQVYEGVDRCDAMGDPPRPGTCRNYDNSNTFIGWECPYYRNTGDPSSCTSSNIGGGLRQAAAVFSIPPIRRESLWVAILLAGGPANATLPLSNNPITQPPYLYPDVACPPSTWTSPFCRDASASSRHPSNSSAYDADDYARDQADFLADPVNGQGVIVFTIGLGNLVRNAPSGDPDAGEKLLKYVAEQAGDPHARDHGEYFYSPSTSQLREIFRQIANRIATKLSR